MFDLPFIRSKIAEHPASFVTPGPNTRQAAVAIVLREAAHDLEMLFIKRAEKDGDPWSGHMAYPGGHRDPTDSGLLQAAVRETSEEIDLALSDDHHLGPLDHHRAQPRGRVLDMLIAPHVFAIEGDPIFNPNYEVDEVVWAPVTPMARNEIHDTETKDLQGTPTIFNGYRLAGGHFVWGLTYRVLKDFFTTLDPNWVGPKEL